MPVRLDHRRILVIGYGNPWRRDDGLGPAMAGAMAAWNWPGLRVVTTLQLTPELACDVSESNLAVFIDAHAAAAEPRIERIEAAVTCQGFSHVSSPQSILALSHAVYGRAPEAWWVTVPGEDFGLGEGLSSAAHAQYARALQFLEQRLRQWCEHRQVHSCTN